MPLLIGKHVPHGHSFTALVFLHQIEREAAHLPPGLGEIVRRREARVELKGCRGGEGGWGKFLNDWLTQEGGEEGGKGRGDGGEAGEHLVLPALHSSSPLKPTNAAFNHNHQILMQLHPNFYLHSYIGYQSFCNVRITESYIFMMFWWAGFQVSL